MGPLLILIGTASGLAHSLYSAVSKTLLKGRVADPLVFLLYVNLAQAVVTLPVWLAVQPVVPPPASLWPLAAAGLTCALAYLFLYLALACGDVSSVMPIMGSKVIFSGLLAGLMLGELHGWPIYTATVLVAVSVAMLSYSPSGKTAPAFPLKPVALMLACSVVFGFTDIYIKRSLAFMDAYNFMVYYNLMGGLLSLALVPWLRHKGVPLRMTAADMGLTAVAAVFLVAATLLFVVTFNLAGGVVIPNILMATRGIFIVIISAVLTMRGSNLLDRQGRHVYLLRFAAAGLIVLSIWIALGR